MESLLSGNVENDVEMFRRYVCEVANGLSGSALYINKPKATAIFESIYESFPYEQGFSAASIFKKAAAFCLLVSELRVTSVVIDDDEDNSRYFNEIIAFNYPLHCLWQAEIFWKDGTKIVLNHEPVTSAHFRRDVFDFLSTARYRDHYRCTALLFEALTYGANPHARYPE